MSKIIFIVYVMFCFSKVDAQQRTTPMTSPTQTLIQIFGLSTIEISYSRPGVKGRKIFGETFPYGKVWRTGANYATTIKFGEGVIIGGVKVPEGKYGLLSIPDVSEWTIIISKQIDVSNPDSYKQEMDMVRVKATSFSLLTPKETFTINIEDVMNYSCNVSLMWDKVCVMFPVYSDTNSNVIKRPNEITKVNTPPIENIGDRKAKLVGEWIADPKSSVRYDGNRITNITITRNGENFIILFNKNDLDLKTMSQVDPSNNLSLYGGKWMITLDANNYNNLLLNGEIFHRKN